jgi:phage head maturation protease
MFPIQREVKASVAEQTTTGVVLRALPLDVPTRVSDDGLSWYSEVWRAGAFDKLQPSKTVLQRGHGDANGTNVVGICRAISEADGHVIADFDWIDGAPLTALARRLVTDGAWEYASVSVIMARDGVKQTGDMVERTRVGQFRHLALVEIPAYESAKVVAQRDALDLSVYLARLERARMLGVKRPRHGPPR